MANGDILRSVWAATLLGTLALCAYELHDAAPRRLGSVVSAGGAPILSGAVPTIQNGKGYSCSFVTSDAGGGATAVQAAYADGGPASPAWCRLKALSTNSASVFVGCGANVTATAGATQGEELAAANGFGEGTPEFCSSLPYGSSTAASQTIDCQCYAAPGQ